ncbi:MAG: AI-2E family transporter [Candidatus Eisenbacteria bacterium]|nr:AI-2E family transporter [Candidatus Eisenbacteria bacterium]
MVDRIRFSRAFLVLLVVVISAAFLAMIRSFLLTLLLAAIFSGLAHPLYRRLLALFRGRRTAASLVTLALLVAVVVVPLIGLLGVVAGEAIQVSEEVSPWIGARFEEPGLLLRYLERVPVLQRLVPYRGEILQRAAALVGGAGQFLFNSLSAATRGTVSFLFQFFIMLYAMFFFLVDGGRLLDRILYYLPLDDCDERRMTEKFVSVTRATLKGTLLIGLVQGILAGVAFWIAGIDGPVFWGTVMTFLSVIPGVGTALVWLPAALILIATDRIGSGIFLILFCGLVVGSADNLLRPRVVGRDTQMHDLLIFLGTVGGLLFFGVLGFIIGPILTALFVTIWEIYGRAFRDELGHRERSET